MKHEKCSKILATIIIFAFSIPILGTFAASDQIQANLNVICDGDGVCEGAYGENQINCPTDCGCDNNGICEPARGENSTNCFLDCPVSLPPAPPPSETGGALFLPDAPPPVIYNLLVSEITLNSANISWETNEYALCQVFLGNTQDYEFENIVEAALYEKHSTKLINLLSKTTYYFKISCRDAAKNESETTGQKLTTLTPPDITPPANVSNFEAIAGDGQVELKWKNPPDLDFKAVKIMRSTDFYPSDPLAGTLIYNGNGKSFLDTGLTNRVRYYYTAFAYDKTGNYSSGAIVSGVPHEPGVIPPSEEMPTSTIPITPEIEKLNFNDFDFFQGGEKIIPTEGKFDIKSGMPLTASIAYEKVPEVLKTIMATLSSGEKVFSFLLRINKEKTRYEAIIASPDPGVYPLTLNILDYKNQALKKITGQLIIEESKTAPAPIPWYKKSKNWFCLLLGLIILALIIYLLRRKRKKDKNLMIRDS